MLSENESIHFKEHLGALFLSKKVDDKSFWAYNTCID
jgi:hypothetical protein